MKKQAQQNTLDVKQQELQNAINTALGQLNTRLQDAARELAENAEQEMQTIVDNLSENVEQKITEIKSMMPRTQQQTDDKKLSQTRPVLSIRSKNKKTKSLYPAPKHPTPRGSEETSDLPDFWRKNYDYGESPYMHIDELEKITDDVSKLRKRKKNKGKK